jgi:hypothetical protein
VSLEHGRPDDLGVIFDDRLYSRPEVSKILGVSVAALEQDACNQRLGGIAFLKLGRLVRYRGSTLKRIMRERERAPLGTPK